tara:strand:- start:3247 stop:4806 length:1560 start_codon:yes stop_codon:yes gene_type:complete
MKYLLLPLIILILGTNCSSKVGNNLRFEEYTITMLQNGYIKGDFSVANVVEYYLNAIESIDINGPSLNSIISVNPDALDIAKTLDNSLSKGKTISPLFGIPIILKDNINTKDNMPTTAGSRILANSYPLKNSWVAEKLVKSNAIIIGKANLSEWANYRASFSSSGWSGINGQTKNPYVLDRNPCGSSSGSAVAVSANLCVAAIGTETWGSIMCPSNANGIVGIKPTVGLWSRTGIIPISHTQDTAGPMARTLKDACILLGAITGIDSSDSKTILSKGNSYNDYVQFLNKNGLKGKRIGYLKSEEGKNFKVDMLVSDAISFMRKMGAEIIDLESIVTGTPHADSRIVMSYEFKDGINKYLNDLGKMRPVKDLNELITLTYQDSIEMKYFNLLRMENSNKKGELSEKEYTSALSNMLKSFQENGIDRAMDENLLDAIICPTGSPAWKTDLINGDNFGLSSSVYAALSGYPNITIPMGFIENLPVGLSFFGRKWSEPHLIEIAYAYEQGTNHRSSPQFLETD